MADVPVPGDLVVRAREGDLQAYGRLVEATQRLVYAVAYRVLRDRGLAEDAAQETFLRAYRRLGDLAEPAAFLGWLRRIAITVAMNMRRRRRVTLLQLDEGIDVPVLDELETRWSEPQRMRLAGALLTLSSDDRRVCDRRYHGGWSIARLAAEARIGEAAMRKRLQRIRDRLRREMEMAERRELGADVEAPALPAKVVELLARPQLTDLPENPVGRTIEALRAVFAGFDEAPALPEMVDLAEARQTVAGDAVYVDPGELHWVDERRVLRYDLTLPLLQSVRYEGKPLRLWATGKAYRRGRLDAMHLEVFHQAEVLWMDDRERVDPWQLAGLILHSVSSLLPGHAMTIVPTEYVMCREAWELEIERDGRSHELLAWGMFTDRIVQHLGGDPRRHAAAGIGFGLERLAMLRYGIDDIRRIEAARVE